MINNYEIIFSNTTRWESRGNGGINNSRILYMKQTLILLICLFSYYSYGQVVLDKNDCYPESYHLVDTTYYSSGEIEKLLFVDSNMNKIVLVTFYIDGNIKSCSGSLKNRNYYSKDMYWYENGNKDAVYDLDKKTVMQGDNNYSWYESGKIKSHSIFKNDTVVTNTFDTNGNTIKITKSLGIALIYTEDRCSNGQVIYQRDLTDKKAHLVQYYCNGQIHVISTRNEKNQLIGTFNYYAENGSLLIEGEYEEHDRFEEIKTGKWTYKDENGKLKKIEFYKNGEIIKERIYN